MELQALKDTPPWDWPESAGKMLLKVLQDTRSEQSDRLLAAELAGDFTVINEELVDTLLLILRSADEPDQLRATTAISLGPVIEEMDTTEFDEFEEAPIGEAAFLGILESTHKLHMDADVPEEVRRGVLEASVRAPRDWHRDAIRTAYLSGDREWNLAAIFCMRWVDGFDSQILEALHSKDPDIHYQAVCAAGNWGIDGAWQHVAALVSSTAVDKDLRLAAIDAVAWIRPEEAGMLLVDLIGDDDEDVVAAAHEAMALADGPSDDEDEGIITIH